MKDISFDKFGKDLKVRDTVVYKAKNLLTTQLGWLVYNAPFGVDLARFLDPDVKIQIESFRAYCLEKMGENSINVIKLIQTDEKFSSALNFIINDIAKGQLTK